MANLKLDLINKFNNEKMFAELELVRLAQEPNMNYEEKLDLMQVQIDRLILLDGRQAKVDQYFQEPAPQAAPAPAPAPEQAPAPAPAAEPQAKVHKGQSHGEG